MGLRARGLAGDQSTSPPATGCVGWAKSTAVCAMCISRRTGHQAWLECGRDSLVRPSRPGGPEHRTANTDSARIEARRLPPDGGYGAPGRLRGRAARGAGWVGTCVWREVSTVFSAAFWIPYSVPPRDGRDVPEEGAWGLGGRPRCSSGRHVGVGWLPALNKGILGSAPFGVRCGSALIRLMLPPHHVRNGTAGWLAGRWIAEGGISRCAVKLGLKSWTEGRPQD
jgi:hypothetical protein